MVIQAIAEGSGASASEGPLGLSLGGDGVVGNRFRAGEEMEESRCQKGSLSMICTDLLGRVFHDADLLVLSFPVCKNGDEAFARAKAEAGKGGERGVLETETHCKFYCERSQAILVQYRKSKFPRFLQKTLQRHVHNFSDVNIGQVKSHKPGSYF